MITLEQAKALRAAHNEHLQCIKDELDGLTIRLDQWMISLAIKTMQNHKPSNPLEGELIHILRKHGMRWVTRVYGASTRIK